MGDFLPTGFLGDTVMRIVILIFLHDCSAVLMSDAKHCWLQDWYPYFRDWESCLKSLVKKQAKKQFSLILSWLHHRREQHLLQRDPK